MAGTFLEGLNLLSISAILGGDGDGGLGSVPRSVCVQASTAGERTDKGRGLRRPQWRRRGIFMRFAHSKRAVWEIAFYYSVLFLPPFTLAVPNANTNNIWHPHAAPLARPLANLQENCKANSAAAPLLLCLLAPGQIFAISWRFHFCLRECMTESDGETLAVSMGKMGSAKKPPNRLRLQSSA